MRLALLALALVSCGPPPHYVTRCGLEYMGEWPHGDVLPGWEQSKMQHFEDLFLSGQAQFSQDARTANAEEACKNLKGYHIWNHETPDVCWPTPWYAKPVCGLTFCAAKNIELGQISIENSAFAHELVHAVQKCNAIQPPTDGRDEAHADWNRNGEQAGINWASQTMRNDVDGGM